MDNSVSQIKEALDIVQVIEGYVPLKQTGKNYSARCPFHQEKTPSFIVSPDIQRYKCFGCGASGDIFNFVQNIENIDFQETLEKLAKMAGIEIKRFEPNTVFKTFEEINYIATKYYYNELKKSIKASKYLDERGINKDSIKSFGLGYAPQKPHLLQSLMEEKKYTRKDLQNSGLFVEKEGRLKEKFYDRIMFPIRSKRGKVIGFTARVLPGNDWGPKYMNTPETPIFHKKENLFGQYESRQEIRKSDLAIICEGSTDVISAHQNGIKNIVAPLGTSLTKEQLLSLKSQTKNVLFFFDSDSAGKGALLRGFLLASELQMNPYAASSFPYKDLDELLQQDVTAAKKQIETRAEAFSFILQDFLADKNLEKLRDMEDLKKLVTILLGSVTDETTRNHYIQKLEKITKITYQQAENGHVKTKLDTESSRVFPVKRNKDMVERRYIGLLLIGNDEENKPNIPSKYFADRELRRIYEIILNVKGLDRELLYKELDNEEELRNIFEDIIFEADQILTDKVSITDQLEKCAKQLETRYYERRRQAISIKIAMAEELGDNKTSERLLLKLQNINNKLKGTHNDKNI